MIRLLSYLFGCRHAHYSWPITAKGQTYVVCWDCSRRVPYRLGEGKISRWQWLSVACFLLLLVGCTPPKEQAKKPAIAPKQAPIAGTADTITWIEQPRVLFFCDKSGQHPYKSQFSLDCWSEKEDRFVRLTLLEQ